MSDPTAFAGALERDLRSYFAATTSTELPRRITAMSARTLGARRSPAGRLLAGGVGVLATAALVVVVATHIGPHGGATSSSLSAGSNAPFGSAIQPPKSAAALGYPGVDTRQLAAAGIALLPPAGHGAAIIAAAEAQVDATAYAGAPLGAAGPAILVFAELTGPPQPATCLCWAVDVPNPGASALAGTRTQLVLVDAVSGRIVTALSGHGVP